MRTSQIERARPLEFYFDACEQIHTEPLQRCQFRAIHAPALVISLLHVRWGIRFETAVFRQET